MSNAANVLDAEPAIDSILEKVSTALTPAFRRSLAGMENPYGDGNASRRITEVLTTVPLKNLLRKYCAVYHEEGRQPS